MKKSLGILAGAFIAILLIHSILGDEPKQDPGTKSPQEAQKSEENYAWLPKFVKTNASRSSGLVMPTFNGTNIWTLPKPALTNYSQCVHLRTETIRYQADGGKGYCDVAVACFFPICIRTDGTTNMEYVKTFREIMDRQTDWNRKYLSKPSDIEQNLRKPPEPEPIREGHRLQYELMVKEERTIPPVPEVFVLSDEFLTLGDGAYKYMTPETIYSFLESAQIKYLVNDTPDVALTILRSLKQDITDQQAAFLLRTSTERLMIPTGYTVYSLPKK